MMSHMNMSRRRLLQLMGLGAAGTALAACQPTPAQPAGTEGAEKEAPGAAEKEAEPAAKEPITLVLHMRAGGEESEAPIYVERPQVFMDNHPDIKIELSPFPASDYFAKISTMAAAGTIGDCLWSRATYGHTERHYRLGVISPLDEYMDAKGVSPEEWVEGARELCTIEGKFCAIPKNANAHAYVYMNTDLLAEKVGAEPPAVDGLTKEDLASWAVQLSEGPEDDRSVFGFYPNLGAHFYIYHFPRMFGSYEMNEEGTESLADSEGWYQAMAYLVDMHKQRAVPRAEAMPSGGVPALFAARKLAMVYSGRWQWKGLDLAVNAQDEPFNWTTVLLPRSAEIPFTTTSDTHEMSATTEHPEEAFEFLYALGDQKFTELVAKGIGYIGARVDDEETIQSIDNPFLPIQYEASRNAGPLRESANLRGDEVSSATVNGLQPLWLLTEELTEGFMQRFKADIDSILAKPMPV